MSILGNLLAFSGKQGQKYTSSKQYDVRTGADSEERQWQNNH